MTEYPEEHALLDPHIRTIVRRDGERLPLLMSANGLPMFDVTVYTMSELRSRHLSVNSIRSHLRAISHFEIFCRAHRIELTSRLDVGRLLSLAEVDALVQACRIPTSALRNQFVQEKRHGQTRIPRIPRARERVRRIQTSKPVDLVVDDVTRTRLQSILRYLDWLVRDRLTTLAWDSEMNGRLESERDQTVAAATARLPQGSGRDPHTPREGLPPHDVQRLLEITDFDSSANPWTNPHARMRNALIIRCLLALGLRRGELLNIKVSDINFQKEEVSIIRRPHDVSDPRRDQPLVKTRGRILPIDRKLVQMMRTYVMEHRSSGRRAHCHDFLFVSSRTGAPLSIVALGKVFATLKEDCGLPSGLCPHALRHTWNDRFSEECHRLKIPEELEKKMRCYWMGWSEVSNTAAIYTRRHTRRQGRKVSLALQAQITGK